MTARTVNGDGNGLRTGAQALMLAVPLNGAILRALSTGSLRQVELRREFESPAQSTLRSHLEALEAVGAIARRRRGVLPGSVEYELAEPGRELRFVILALERWLAEAPEEPLELHDDAAKAAVKALLENLSYRERRVLELALRPRRRAPAHPRRGRPHLQRHPRANPPDREPEPEKAPAAGRSAETARSHLSTEAPTAVRAAGCYRFGRRVEDELCNSRHS